MLGDTMQVYVNDMLVQSKKGVDHEQDLERAFAQMKLHNIHLNPAKCVFGVNSRKFPGFTMRQRVIEVNPKNLSAIE